MVSDTHILPLFTFKLTGLHSHTHILSLSLMKSNLHTQTHILSLIYLHTHTHMFLTRSVHCTISTSRPAHMWTNKQDFKLSDSGFLTKRNEEGNNWLLYCFGGCSQKSS